MLAQSYPVALVCDVLGCARSSYYHQAKPQDDTRLMDTIKAVVAEWPTYGYRRVTAQLKRQGWDVNHKRVRRLMRLMDLPIKPKRRKQRTTNSEHDFPRYPNLVEDLEIVRPDQVWVSDITYVHLLDEFIYLAVIMDVFTRAIRGWHLGRSLDHSLTLLALQQGWLTTRLQRFITLTRVYSTPVRVTHKCSRMPTFRSAWPKWEKPGRMVTQSD